MQKQRRSQLFSLNGRFLAKIFGSKERRPQKWPKKDPNSFFHETFKSYLIIMKFILEVQQQDLGWFSMKLFISFDTDQKLFFVTFGIKVNYLQYPEVPYVPMCFNLSISNCSLTLRWILRAIVFIGVFFFIFRKKAFSKVASTFFLIESAIHKNLLHYKSCPLKNLSSRKSWEIFALSFEKTIFFSDILIKWRFLFHLVHL